MFGGLELFSLVSSAHSQPKGWLCVVWFLMLFCVLEVVVPVERYLKPLERKQQLQV